MVFSCEEELFHVYLVREYVLFSSVATYFFSWNMFVLCLHSFVIRQISVQ